MKLKEKFKLESLKRIVIEFYMRETYMVNNIYLVFLATVAEESIDLEVRI
jgi:hypothetical protein